MPGRPAWSALSRWPSAACGGCGWSTRRRWRAATCAGSRACRGSASGARVAAYRTVQARRLANLEIELGHHWTAAEVAESGADIVVVATGSQWAADGLNSATRGPIPGADASLAHVLTPEQIVLDGKRPPGSRVVVYDCDGYYAGARGGRAACRRGPDRRAGHLPRAGGAVCRRDAGGRAHPRAAARRGRVDVALHHGDGNRRRRRGRRGRVRRSGADRRRRRGAGHPASL